MEKTETKQNNNKAIVLRNKKAKYLPELLAFFW